MNALEANSFVIGTAETNTHTLETPVRGWHPFDYEFIDLSLRDEAPELFFYILILSVTFFH